jgi:hypothetical protein
VSAIRGITEEILQHTLQMDSSLEEITVSVVLHPPYRETSVTID